MRKDYLKSLSELKEYLDAYTLTNQLKNAKLDASLNSYYKKYYALLIWNNIIQNNHIFQRRYSKAKLYRTYFKESLSDICQAFFLAIQGFYKPAFLSLRSGIENYIRCIGISGDLKVLNADNVFDLFELVKTDSMIKRSSLAMNSWQTLRHEYTVLCQYVHTSSISHMSQVEFLNNFPGYSEAEADNFFETVQKVTASIVVLSIVSFPACYKKLHHSLYDAVCDTLSRSTKNKLFKII